MNQSSPTGVQSGTSPVSQEAAEERALNEAIHRSCRVPVLVMIMSGGVWLLIASILGLLSSIKLHSPDFLGDIAWLTFGRVYPASLNALVYGFCLQASFGVGLWLLCRLGRTRLSGGGFAVIGAAFWNLALTAGLIGILAGMNTGFKWLEMPRYAAVVLFFSYVLIGGAGLVTLHFRQARAGYVSQWFLLAGLLWFPWIYSSAQLLLLFEPVRGVMQGIVAGWYGSNLVHLNLALLGLAATFYFVPKLLNRPLHSHQLALWSFWIAIICGSWSGINAGAPVPKWIPSASAVVNGLYLAAVVAIAVNLGATIFGRSNGVRPSFTFLFVAIGAAAYLIAGLLEAVNGVRGFSQIFGFTIFEPGLTYLMTYGFVMLTIAGASYYIVPRLLGVAELADKQVGLHLGLGVAGALLTSGPLLIGGFFHGMAINSPNVPYVDVARLTIPFVGISTLGFAILILSNGLFLVNLGRLYSVLSPICCRPAGGSASGKATEEKVSV